MIYLFNLYIYIPNSFCTPRISNHLVIFCFCKIKVTALQVASTAQEASESATRTVTKTTPAISPAISNLKGKLAALELEQAQDEAAEQEHAEASVLAAKIAALEEQKKKKVAATEAAALGAVKVGCHFNHMHR